MNKRSNFVTSDVLCNDSENYGVFPEQQGTLRIIAKQMRRRRLGTVDEVQLKRSLWNPKPQFQAAYDECSQAITEARFRKNQKRRGAKEASVTL